jgi:predicted transcriptional regulator
MCRDSPGEKIMEKKVAVAPVITSVKAKEMRSKSGQNQSDFWKPLGVTQSGGSRYESGRGIPRPVQFLLMLKHGNKKERLAVLEVCGIDLSAVAAEIVAQKEAGKAA